jgi:putative restriction endonuclease
MIGRIAVALPNITTRKRPPLCGLVQTSMRADRPRNPAGGSAPLTKRGVNQAVVSCPLRESVTKTDALLREFRDLNVWRRGDERAPHKPLLVLYALGQLQAGAGRLIPFDQLERPLERLLEEFGPPRKSPHPELPFYHLQHDGVWEIDEGIQLTRRKGSKNPLRTELRKWRVTGGFKQRIFDELTRRPEAVRELAREVLSAHFPESLHHNIASAVGLDLGGTSRGGRRDSEFRSAVVSAWGHRCAFCGFAVQLDNADLGLEAAHIRWCQFGGPDTIDNGLACCSIHHQAFDRGAITISEQLRILVSSRLHGSRGLDDLFLALHGSPLRAPNLKDARPKREFLEWHRAEVFRGEARS